MGEVTRKANKPLQINPIKLSQPMGAALAFLGVNRCMPLMHGALGCASFTKVFLTRHFSEPIAIQTTAVTDITAILDGGDYNIVEAVKNITAKVSPRLVGLHTTGLTETKGDDIAGVAAKIDVPLVHVNTPDYEGGLESGWALATRALIRQLVRPTTEIKPGKLVLLPHVGLQPIEVEKIKDFITLFGFEVHALPDLSTSLDGHLGQKQGALSGGGIEVEDIKNLAEAGLVVTVGASMKPCGAAFLEKNPGAAAFHFDHLQGLEATDALVAMLLAQSATQVPHPSVVRWRLRLQDALLDSHFALGQTRFLVAGDPDQIAGICQALHEAGGRVALAVASVDSPQLTEIKAARILVGDLQDAEILHDEYDMILGNFHCEALADRYRKGLVLRGFPNWEQVGNQLKNDVLYEGGSYFLFEAANAAEHMRTHFAKG
ncbi:nitrogenase molybdenum-iron protein NifN [Geoalkalibacter ferrihydriticus]|uniref:Nitrogenase iron-molybdenum cofactor biosynthesis protein NifN n=2 Tax=Geoalkalibacter ferrihydriticus TaxID=392333 RepID=A0A0C2DV71_9BACT|nr:nitrogenase iron-molybdenum cofactor biosynthesis protein NifN [Geoalkalibacter ferrihydriticus]KIH77329.1 nitrogenase iron-molybdenum cofactor biosynthesis protein NifN [Geoalkalibacter ferrihydriticus DSM 17813]SDM19658.1 nitrogenase molybdenum-iron protein NifN [Geoalkalibacter ferrihydriticus]